MTNKQFVQNVVSTAKAYQDQNLIWYISYSPIFNLNTAIFPRSLFNCVTAKSAWAETAKFLRKEMLRKLES
jgi:hypothetical protein